MVPDEGFEPPSADYKSAAKPTQLIRRYLERVRRIELLSSDWKSVIIPLYDTRLFVIMAGSQGFEPWEDFHPRRFSRPVLSTTQPAALHNNKS